MPIAVRSSSRRMPAAQANPAGGYSIPGVPDPNEEISGGGGSPFGANTGDPQGNAVMLRGMDNRRRSDWDRSTSFDHGFGIFNSLSGVAPDPKWEGFKQSLHEAGAGKISTTGGMKKGPAGFFDVQGQSQDDQRRGVLAEILKANDFNRNVRKGTG